MAALWRIDPEIVADHDVDKVVNRGRDHCGTINKWPKDQAKQVTLTNTWFTSADHLEWFGATIAKKINAVVVADLCPVK